MLQTSTSPGLLQNHGSVSPAKLGGIQSRRQRNQPPSRQHDLEFAAELGQGLIVEVRKLQGLLSEREEALKIIQIQKSELDQDMDAAQGRIKSLDESEARFKEENWNLELTLQDLQTQLAEYKETETRLHAQISVLQNEKRKIGERLDELKQQHSKLEEESEHKSKLHDNEAAALRRVLASTETERDDLKKRVDELNREAAEASKASLRLHLEQQRTDREEKRKDPSDLPPPSDDDSPETSPPPSPLKNTPRHNPGLELETVRSSLHHAHRMITNLKSNIHREKTEKAELKRLLQDARDELETARSGFGTPVKEKKRRGDGTFKKSTRVGMNLIGGVRKSRHDVYLQDDEWEELHGNDSDSAGRARSPSRRPPGTYISTTEAESPFETANEKETTDAFETATENEHTGAETEAYRTGAESPINDNPTSADDMTETEGRSLRTIKGKSSNLSRSSGRSSGGGSRPRRFSSMVRQRLDSVASTGSTEDEYELQHQYTNRMVDSDNDLLSPNSEYDDQVDSPFAPNPRLKLRISRARSRGSRMSSQNRFFNAGSYNDDSQDASSMDESSPAPRQQHKPSTLFAELDAAGDSGSSDPGDDYDDSMGPTETDTPSKSTRRSPVPPLRYVQMVDSSMNTEEPYPEAAVLTSDSESERPTTAIAAGALLPILGAETMPKAFSRATSDAGVQSDEEPKATMMEAGTQADAAETLETGTQSEPEPEIPVIQTYEAGTQSDPEPEIPVVQTYEAGTQSDPEPETPVIQTYEAGTQSDPEPETPVIQTYEAGTQSDPEPEAPVVQTYEAGTQCDPEPEKPVIPVVIPVVKSTSSSGTQHEPEEEKVVEPVVEKEPVALGMFLKTTADIEPVEPKAIPVVVPVPQPEPKVITPEPLEVFITTAAETTPMDPKIVPKEPLEVFVTTAAETAPVDPKIVHKEPLKSSLVYSTQAETIPVEPLLVPQVIHKEPSTSSFVYQTHAEIVPEPETKKTVIAPALTPLEFSTISTLDTTPDEEDKKASAISSVASAAAGATAAAAAAIVATAAATTSSAPADAGLSSDEDTPKKVSETVEESQRRSTSTPPSVTPERRGFFGSLFGSRRQDAKHAPEPESDTEIEHISTSELKRERTLDGESDNEETVRIKDSPGRAKLSAMQMSAYTPTPAPPKFADQVVQTEISSDYFNRLAQDTQGPKNAVVAGGVRVVPATPSLRSRASEESMGFVLHRTSTDGSRTAAMIKRPGSSSSMRDQHQRGEHPPLPSNHQEQIAAAQQQKHLAGQTTDYGLMGPPPIPTTPRASHALRPRTPQEQQRRPETPNSRSGATPRARYSSIRSEVSSPHSRRSSLSSFRSELDDRFNMQQPGYMRPVNTSGEQATDPKVIQAITQTMIGDYLWKYTRTAGRGMSGSRHRRFFWVHPYTRTLYWSDRDPQSAGRNELRAKSVAIEAIRVVTDDNTSPPGLHRKSLVIITPGRTLKFTAPTGALHETWFSALSYLLLRTGEAPGEAGFEADDLRDFQPYTPTPGAHGSLSSFASRTTRAESPSLRAQSSLSSRMDAQRRQGSMSRLSNIFRTSSTFSSRHDNPSEMSSSVDDFSSAAERQAELDRMENVRACCDGKTPPLIILAILC